VDQEQTMRKTILMADDDPKIRKLMRDLFEREADYFLCEEASNGKEAIEIATQCKADLIILDFSMPVMSGIQAAKQLKKLMPAVPIVLFTMHDKAVFTQVSYMNTVIDRIVAKTDVGTLLAHVRDLLPEEPRLNKFSASA
jgi:CheY-like chemotaxis protein